MRAPSAKEAEELLSAISRIQAEMRRRAVSTAGEDGSSAAGVPPVVTIPESEIADIANRISEGIAEAELIVEAADAEDGAEGIADGNVQWARLWFKKAKDEENNGSKAKAARDVYKDKYAQEVRDYEIRKRGQQKKARYYQTLLEVGERSFSPPQDGHKFFVYPFRQGNTYFEEGTKYTKDNFKNKNFLKGSIGYGLEYENIRKQFNELIKKHPKYTNNISLKVPEELIDSFVKASNTPLRLISVTKGRSLDKVQRLAAITQIMEMYRHVKNAPPNIITMICHLFDIHKEKFGVIGKSV